MAPHKILQCTDGAEIEGLEETIPADAKHNDIYEHDGQWYRVVRSFKPGDEHLVYGEWIGPPEIPSGLTNSQKELLIDILDDLPGMDDDSIAVARDRLCNDDKWKDI